MPEVNEGAMRRAILLKALSNKVAELIAENKKTLGMPSGQTNRIEIDGTVVGTVAMTVPSRSVIVTDEAALIDWADRLYPDEVEVVTRVRPAFQASWTVVGEHVLTNKGDIVEGVAVGVGSSFPSVKPARDQAELLWSAVRSEVRELLAGDPDE